MLGLENDEQRIGKALGILEQSLHEFKKQYQVQADPAVLKMIQLIPLVLEEVQILQGRIIKAIIHPQVEEELSYLREKKEKYKRAYLSAAEELKKTKTDTMLSSSSGASGSNDPVVKTEPVPASTLGEASTIPITDSLLQENQTLQEQVKNLESQLGDLRLQLFKINSASGLHNVNWNSQTLVKQMDQLKLQNQSTWSSIFRLFTGDLSEWIQWDRVMLHFGITATSIKMAPKLGKLALIGAFVPFCYDLLQKKLQSEDQKQTREGIDFWKKRKAMPNDIYEYFVESWMNQSILLEMMEFLAQFICVPANSNDGLTDANDSLREMTALPIDLETAQTGKSQERTALGVQIDTESPLCQRHKGLFPSSLYPTIIQKVGSLHGVLLRTTLMCILMEVELYSTTHSTPFDETIHTEDDVLDQGQLVKVSTFPGVKIAGQIAIKELVLLD
jgi:hypothetical protein